MNAHFRVDIPAGLHEDCEEEERIDDDFLVGGGQEVETAETSLMAAEWGELNATVEVPKAPKADDPTAEKQQEGDRATHGPAGPGAPTTLSTEAALLGKLKELSGFSDEVSRVQGVGFGVWGLGF